MLSIWSPIRCSRQFFKWFVFLNSCHNWSKGIFSILFFACVTLCAYYLIWQQQLHHPHPSSNAPEHYSLHTNTAGPDSFYSPSQGGQQHQLSAAAAAQQLQHSEIESFHAAQAHRVDLATRAANNPEAKMVSLKEQILHWFFLVTSEINLMIN